MQSPERISTLLYKKLHEGLSPAEYSELESWASESEANRELLENISDPDSLKEMLQDYHYFKETGWTEIQKKIKQQTESTPTATETPIAPMHSVAKRFWVRWAVAAALVLIAWGIYKFIVKQEEPTKQKLVEDGSQVPPGRDRALLRLSDGTTITLDSAHIGQLAQLGSTRVNKEDSGLVSFTGGGYTLNPSAANETYNLLGVPRSGQFSAVLPDGTKVWLNAASSLKFPTAFSGDERKVWLVGEAYFEVAKNESMPFIVIAGNDMEVKVLGTHFNLSVYPDEPMQNATLLEGSLQVGMTVGNVQPIVLKPGERASIAEGAGGIKVIKMTDAADAIAWKNGTMAFHDADVGSILRIAARWYDLDLQFEGKLTDRHFTGGIPRDSPLSELLKLLSLYKIHYKLEGKKLTILG